MIKNMQKEALLSNLSLDEFAQAMQALDLLSIPEEKRKRAIMDHLAGIMIESVYDRRAAVELAAARIMRAKQS